jgi:hypothetical protein
MFAAVFYVLGGMFCLYALYGFWRGLGMRPGHHAPPSADLWTDFQS